MSRALPHYLRNMVSKGREIPRRPTKDDLLEQRYEIKRMLTIAIRSRRVSEIVKLADRLQRVTDEYNRVGARL